MDCVTPLRRGVTQSISVLEQNLGRKGSLFRRALLDPGQCCRHFRVQPGQPDRQRLIADDVISIVPPPQYKMHEQRTPASTHAQL